MNWHKGVKLTKPKRANGAVIILLAIGSALMFVPVLWIILSSFKSLSEIYRSPPTFLPERWIFTNYKEAIAQFRFLRYLWNSILVTLSATLPWPPSL